MTLGVFAAWVALSLASVPAEPAPELLARLAEHDARAGAVLERASFLQTTRVEELDSKRAVVHTHEDIWRIRAESGRQNREVVRAVEDGKDVTDEYRAKVTPKGSAGQGQEKEPKKEKKKKSQGISLQAESPFSAKAQPRYRFTVAGPDAKDPSLLRLHFEPRGEASPELTIGDATVDPSKGELVRLSQRPSKNPRFVDRLSVELELDEKTSAGRTLSRVKFDGEGGFLFLRKRMRGTVTFSGFDEVTPAPAP